MSGPRHESAWERSGGLSGLIESSLPPAALVIINTLAGLTAAVIGAVGLAAALTVLRVLRRRPLRPALGGFIGVAIAAFIAYRSGSVSGYFLAGIWWSLACAGVLTLTILIRRPLVGVVWSVMNRAPFHWLADRRAVLRFDLATATLAVVFAARYVVQRWLYDEDLTGWLAFAKIAMGFPLWLLALTVVVWAVRRSPAPAPR
ncbi:DUF3159 domain-containing protein [Nonomuraea sp. NPDC050404]|uniref:DUF3159 domain-containing protein n=1 Tax=Nonomuraea sp. NPDC050404 TaxID=3155783 RepID=UPI003409D2BD